MRALVGAEDDADVRALLGCLNPCTDFAGVGGDRPFDDGCADVAAVSGGVRGRVASFFLLGVVAGRFVGADGQGVDWADGVLQVLPPDLGDQGDGGAQDDGNAAAGRQCFDDAQRNTGLAGAARQDDFAAGLACRQSAAGALDVVLENADGGGDGFILHTRLGLACRLRCIRFAVGARLFVLSVALIQQVGVDVDGLDGAVNAAHGESLTGLLTEGRFAVDDQPAFRPERVGRCVCKRVQFAFLDCYGYAVVETPGLALDGNVTSVTAPHGYDVDADVLMGGAGEDRFAVRPFRPGPAAGDVPFLDVGADGCGEVFQPFAA